MKKLSRNDFFVFDWMTSETQEGTLQINQDEILYLVIHKEIKNAYSENTNKLEQISYCIYIHSPIELTNFLPIFLECLINVS